MKKKFLSAAVASCVAVMGAGQLHAQSSVISESDSGDVLIVPYYTVQNAVENGNRLAYTSQFSIVNTTADFKAVKVKIRRASDSNSIFNFQVYLSPYDVWNASIYQPVDGFAPLIATNDTTCTAGKIFGETTVINGITFPGVSLGGGVPLAGADITAALEGYIEILEMATLRHPEADYTLNPNGYKPLAWFAKHSSGAVGDDFSPAGTPRDCSVFTRWHTDASTEARQLLRVTPQSLGDGLTTTQGSILSTLVQSGVNLRTTLSDNIIPGQGELTGAQVALGWGGEDTNGNGRGSQFGPRTGGLIGFGNIIDVNEGINFPMDLLHLATLDRPGADDPTGLSNRPLMFSQIGLTGGGNQIQFTVNNSSGWLNSWDNESATQTGTYWDYPTLSTSGAGANPGTPGIPAHRARDRLNGINTATTVTTFANEFSINTIGQNTDWVMNFFTKKEYLRPNQTGFAQRLQANNCVSVDYSAWDREERPFDVPGGLFSPGGIGNTPSFCNEVQVLGFEEVNTLTAATASPSRALRSRINPAGVGLGAGPNAIKQGWMQITLGTVAVNTQHGGNQFWNNTIQPNALQLGMIGFRANNLARDSETGASLQNYGATWRHRVLEPEYRRGPVPYLQGVLDRLRNING